MLKKTLTFEKLDGTKITEDFWFHLNKAEVAELKFIHGDGLEGLIKTLNVATDGQAVIDSFRMIIAKTVGRPSEDGVSFEKDAAYTKRFMSSDAYSTLFMEIISEDDSGASFIFGVLPKDMQEEARKRQLEQAKQIPAGSEPWIIEDREPTKDELATMSKEQMFQVMQRRVTQK